MKPQKPIPKKAVALRYSQDTDLAPKLVAKGKGLIAEKIIESAKESGVPIQEDPSLVEILGQLELDQQIPPELYQVIAEILTMVYRADGQVGSNQKNG
jgi:flagellar biosynthesis protein